MSDPSRALRQVLTDLPHVGERQLFPGLSVATMPRPQDLLEVEVAPQAHTIAVYARRGRDLREPIARGMPDRRVRDRSVMVLPPGLATRWIFARPLTDTRPRLQTLHMRLDDAFAVALERQVDVAALASGMNVQIPGLAGRMERALAAFEAPASFRSVALQSAALAAATLLVDPEAARTSANASSLTARRRRALRAYVDEHLSDEVTLAGMADAVGLSPWHFVRVFKAATGMTPYAWVVSRRVERVKQMLLLGQLSLAEVAVACGFATQSHMTDVFRRTVGITPGRWRAGDRDTRPDQDGMGMP